MHLCFGNYGGQTIQKGFFRELLPFFNSLHVDHLVLEFARKGDDDLDLIVRSGWERGIGLGVVDVKTRRVESTDLIAQRIRRALALVPADRMQVNPDCGLRHLPPAIAQAKLHAMVAAARTVRGELGMAVAAPTVSDPPVESQ